MSSHFSAKSLSFYAVAIGSVLVLFNVVTAYGESRLKAPTPISGRYRLAFANSLPGCAKPEPLLLQIDQSGIYANGAILSASTTSENPMSVEERLTLTGLFKDKQLNLAGMVPQSVLCNQSPASGAKMVAINSRIEGENMVGEITVDSQPQKTQFTAQKQADAAANKKAASH